MPWLLIAQRGYFVVTPGSAVTFAVTVPNRPFPVTSLHEMRSLLVQCVRDAVPWFNNFWSPCTANPVRSEHQDERCKVLLSQFQKSVQQSEYLRLCTQRTRAQRTPTREVQSIPITFQPRTRSSPSAAVLPARVPYSFAGFLCERVLYISMHPAT